MWRPRGERGLSSCRSRFITLARASPRRRGLRSRGAGSPMTNVPVSRQQAPPGPATPSAQQVPGECLRVSVSGKELLKAQSLQKGYKDSSASSGPPSPCRRHRKRNPQPGGGRRRGIRREPPASFLELKALLGQPDFSFSLSLSPSLGSLPPSRLEAPASELEVGLAGCGVPMRDALGAGPGRSSGSGLGAGSRSVAFSAYEAGAAGASLLAAGEREGAGTRLAVT